MSLQKQTNKALVYGHLGLGDIINNIGMIRYFRTIYDTVTVICKSTNLKNVQNFFSDDSNIDFYVINSEVEIHPFLGGSVAKEKIDKIIIGYDPKFSGLSSFIITGEDKYNDAWAPLVFYEDVNIDPYCFWKDFSIPHTQGSKELYNLVKDTEYLNNYVIIHSQTSAGQLFEVSDVERVLGIDHNKTLIIDINKNIYDDTHPFYELAAKFINKPLIDLVDLICNAIGVVLSDSSFYSLALHLPIKTEKCYYVNRESSNYIDNYSFLYNFPELPSHIRKFKLLPRAPPPIVKYY